LAKKKKKIYNDKKIIRGEVGSGSGWVVVVPLDRGDQCGHFGVRIVEIGAILSQKPSCLNKILTIRIKFHQNNPSIIQLIPSKIHQISSKSHQNTYKIHPNFLYKTPQAWQGVPRGPSRLTPFPGVALEDVFRETGYHATASVRAG
jgi:hypothetical protein